MDNYINKINFDFQTNQSILKSISFIDSFKGKWNIVESKENIFLKELRKIATIESIGSSTRIEGAQLTNEEIKQLLENVKITGLKSRDEQEVVGYYDVLEIIYENYENISISKNYIQQLHQNLLKYSTKDERHRGVYKNLSNKVVANYPDGTQRVLFDTTEPHRVESEMNYLIEWTNEQITSKSLHPLIVIGLFIYEFLSIHPFQDENGRLSRLLTNLLLLKNNYLFIQYVSFENLIEQNKKTYYEALMDGQKNRNSEKEKVDKWMLFFLQSIETLIHRLEQKYDVFKTSGGYLNERQKKIKEFIATNQPIKLSDLVNSMPDVSINTLKKDLQYLKTEQIIVSAGKNKGTFYVLKDK
ncbi:MAG: Fic family protein [Calditrichaceae bacterium]|nr:Fic family protein [Calditrichaceae bacterium]RQV95395.1 MAG: Fic family protein [Calditrichota bacterium]